MSENLIMEIVIAILSFLVAIGGYSIKRLNDSVKSYSKSYGSQIGKIDASTSKLDEIQTQLAESVEISESIRNDIEHGVWRKKELELLKREKLEDYLLHIYEIKENLYKQMKNWYFDETISYDELTLPRLTMIQKLYLSDLEYEHKEYLKEVVNFNKWLIKGREELLEKQRNSENKSKVSKAHTDKFNSRYEGLLKAETLIENKAQEIASRLNVA